ncbi:hypothetical protein [Streptomyces spectabilis]|uniref:Uncharacterized protein n=1 Tax=Streptomyces spectabilis TaxID=68270 RepID=A0A516R1K5_STRST|nr:hypothetical protein [Streptomyces spectabilis]QDQ09539.1 hypothetical protein FH965_02320 [Streptomyces spectabilis]
MRHHTTNRPAGRAGPAARTRRWAATTVIVLLSLLWGGGAAPAVAAAAPDTAAPSRLAAPEPPPATAETRERTLRDGEVPHPPPHFVRGRAHTAPAPLRVTAARARSHTADPADARAARGPTGPRPDAATPARSGAQLLLLHCVSRS